MNSYRDPGRHSGQRPPKSDPEDEGLQQLPALIIVKHTLTHTPPSLGSGNISRGRWESPEGLASTATLSYPDAGSVQVLGLCVSHRLPCLHT